MYYYVVHCALRWDSGGEGWAWPVGLGVDVVLRYLRRVVLTRARARRPRHSGKMEGLGWGRWLVPKWLGDGKREG